MGIHPSQPLVTGAPTVEKKPVHEPVLLSFKHFQKSGDFCLSKCDRQQLKAVADCLRMMTTMTWMELINSGGKPGTKVGLGYTPYEDQDLRHVTRPASLSQDIRIAGVRASEKFRIFGGCHQQVFHVLWFDPNHKIIAG